MIATLLICITKERGLGHRIIFYGGSMFYSTSYCFLGTESFSFLPLYMRNDPISSIYLKTQDYFFSWHDRQCILYNFFHFINGRNSLWRSKSISPFIRHQYYEVSNSPVGLVIMGLI